MAYSHFLKKISIIVPSRQLKRDKNLKHFYRPVTSLPDLIASARQNVSIDHEMVVVVNGETDKKLLDYIHIEKVEKFCINNLNVGVSRAWNMGRQLAEGEYLLFVNDDVTIGKGAVERMMKCLEDEPTVGMVGPHGANWKGAQFTLKFEDGKTEVYSDVILGFCFMVRAKDFDQVGGIDLNYTPAGMEEIDFCYSLRKHGFKMKVLANLDVVTEPRHGISALNTTVNYFNSSVNTEALHERNKAYFKNKWGDLA